MLPASSFKLFDPLINLCIKAEKALGTEVRKGFFGIILVLAAMAKFLFYLCLCSIFSFFSVLFLALGFCIYF